MIKKRILLNLNRSKRIIMKYIGGTWKVFEAFAMPCKHYFSIAINLRVTNLGLYIIDDSQ